MIKSSPSAEARIVTTSPSLDNIIFTAEGRNYGVLLTVSYHQAFFGPTGTKPESHVISRQSGRNLL